MLIEEYDLEVTTPPCEPGAERFTALARLTVDISEVLPYLNTTLRGAVYHHDAQTLMWKKGGHNIAFQPYKIAVSDALDREAAEKEINGIITLVNRTWERRDEITPDFETHRRPTPMEVYQLLPHTNCKQCGEATCWIFALKLIAAQKKLEDCPPIFETQYVDNLAALQQIVISAPTIK